MTSRALADIPWLGHQFGTRSGPPSQEGMASLKQIHSNIVLPASQPGCVGEGDALVTNRAGVPVSIRTADCLPIFLADRQNRAVAAIHAGWRGTAARIVVEALAAMQREFGTQPKNVTAAIGPGIGVCCYEVGEEVARQFGKTGAAYLDLAGENARQLEGAGVRAIDLLNVCTFCHAEQFYSWRRDREKAGRMISVVEIL